MILGIDIGTQSLKAVVVDRALATRGAAATPYQPSYPRPGWVEQDPALWERALAPTIAAALAQAGASPPDIAGIGIGGQLDGCVAVDDDDNALAPCLIWMDRRAQREIEDIPADVVRNRAGVVLDPGHMAAKIRWLERHPPQGRRAARYHQPVSWMVARLTGESVLDHAQGSTTMVYSLRDRGYNSGLLDLFEIEEEKLPRLAASSDCAGRLTEIGAGLTGLPAGTPVATGTGDDFSAPLGAGLVAPGRVSVAIGTGEVVGAVHRRPSIDAEGLVESHAWVAPGYFLENPGWLSGGAVAWLSRLLGIAEPASLDALGAEAPPGADRLLFLPALTGAMAPRWEAAARGCFYGLTPSHGRAHFARAVLEGCAFAMRDVVQCLARLGVAAESLLLLGGGARSRTWAQIRADVAGLPVRIPPRIHTAPIGAAMLGAVAAGIFADLAEAAALVATGGVDVQPDPRCRDIYDEAHLRYRRLFDSLDPMFADPTRRAGIVPALAQPDCVAAVAP
jgi:xylulokinase